MEKTQEITQRPQKIQVTWKWRSRFYDIHCSYYTINIASMTYFGRLGHFQLGNKSNNNNNPNITQTGYYRSAASIVNNKKLPEQVNGCGKVLHGVINLKKQEINLRTPLSCGIFLCKMILGITTTIVSKMKL